MAKWHLGQSLNGGLQNHGSMKRRGCSDPDTAGKKAPNAAQSGVVAGRQCHARPVNDDDNVTIRWTTPSSHVPGTLIILDMPALSRAWSHSGVTPVQFA